MSNKQLNTFRSTLLLSTIFFSGLNRVQGDLEKPAIRVGFFQLVKILISVSCFFPFNKFAHLIQPSVSHVDAFVQFRFATCKDVLMMVVGSICAVLHGSAQPLMLLVFGLLTDTFIDYDIELNELSDDRKECVNNTIQWKRNYNGTLNLNQSVLDQSILNQSVLNQSILGLFDNSTLEMFTPVGNLSCG